jgi:hypothetical protein
MFLKNTFKVNADIDLELVLKVRTFKATNEESSTKDQNNVGDSETLLN